MNFIRTEVVNPIIQWDGTRWFMASDLDVMSNNILSTFEGVVTSLDGENATIRINGRTVHLSRFGIVLNGIPMKFSDFEEKFNENLTNHIPMWVNGGILWKEGQWVTTTTLNITTQNPMQQGIQGGISDVSLSPTDLTDGTI